MPSMFKGTEYNLTTGQPTGKTEEYQANCLTEAVEAARYTHALESPTNVGPSGRTVNYQGLSLVFPKG